MTLHTIRSLASLPGRRTGTGAPVPAPRRHSILTPPALHLVRTMTPVLAAAIRRLARLLRPVA
jgi:hypothetical protein